MKTFLFLASFCLVALADRAYGVSPGLSKKEIEKSVGEMLIAKGYDVAIKKIFAPLNDLQIVCVAAPYREFPSIIIFKKKRGANEWVRVFECLSPGIQRIQSELLDWHTEGLGVDFMFSDNSLFDFKHDMVKTMIKLSLEKPDKVIIPYRHFIHMNVSSSTSRNEKFRPYTIDKTEYFDIANALFDGAYKNYSVTDCAIYDTPALAACEFYMERGKYVIKAGTRNLQIWTYKFSGVDDNCEYLIDKEIKAENVPVPAELLLRRFTPGVLNR